MEQWTGAMEADLQALARLAAWQVCEVAVAPKVTATQVDAGRPQRASLAQLTLEAYERWAATYPGAADALERALEEVPRPEVPWCPPVVQVEQMLAWTYPALKAWMVAWLRTWPANAPLWPSLGQAQGKR